MYYMHEVRIPRQTPADAPQIDRVEVYPGVTQGEWFGFPLGCFGLAHIQVWHHATQLWPWSPHTSYHWDDYIFELRDRYPIDSEPYELVLKTWNLDDSYDHTLFFAVEIEHVPQVAGGVELSQVLADLGALGASLGEGE